MPPMPPMNLGKSYGLPDGLQNIQPLVGKLIEFSLEFPVYKWS